jgi:hypothetical protein
MHRRRRQSIADHDRKPAAIRGACRKMIGAGRLELAPEVRTPQIVATIDGAAPRRKDGKAELGELSDYPLGIEGCMHGVSGARMIEREVEQRPGR